MMRENCIIERGEVMEATPNGYIVKSLDRDGITTPPLKSMLPGVTYAAGDAVHYFLYRDGSGKIICAL